LSRNGLVYRELMLYGRVDPSQRVNFVGMRPAFASRTHSRLPVSSCTAEKRRVNRGYDSSEGNRRGRDSSSKGYFTCRPRGAGVFRTPRRQVVGRVSQPGQRRRYRRHLFRPHRIGELRSPELTSVPARRERFGRNIECGIRSKPGVWSVIHLALGALTLGNQQFLGSQASASGVRTRM
jgi:hypothetical protein